MTACIVAPIVLSFFLEVHPQQSGSIFGLKKFCEVALGPMKGVLMKLCLTSRASQMFLVQKRCRLLQANFLIKIFHMD